MIAEKHAINTEILDLNVGGTTKIMVSHRILTSVPDCALTKLFSGNHPLKTVNGQIFLDRDGKTFNYLVNYLRNNRRVYPDFGDYME